MEVEKITVKVELGGVAVQTVAVLTDREGRTKEGAVGAAAALSAELLAALRDGVDAAVLVAATPAERTWANRAARPLHLEPRMIPEHFCFEHETGFVRHENARGHWFSHQLEDGRWCREVR